MASSYAQEKGYINDPDGYTNIRKQPSVESEIIGKLIEGEMFTYHPSNSNWWKVEFKGVKGFVHSSRIESVIEVKKRINQYFVDYFESDRNNVELSEGNNEKLFLLSEKYPYSLLTSFCELNNEIQVFLLSEYESPIHDLIDLQLIFTRLKNTKVDCSGKQRILDALKLAGQKIGLEIK